MNELISDCEPSACLVLQDQWRCLPAEACHAQVVLVKHDGKYYALKTLLKQQIIDMGLHVRFRAPPQTADRHLV